MKSSYLFRIIFLLNFLLIIGNTEAQTTITLSPNMDAYLLMCAKPGSEYLAVSNYGTSIKYYGEEWTNSGYRVNSRSVLNFDFSQIPANATIISAKLSLYSMKPQTGDDYRHVSYLIKTNTGYKTNASYLERITTSWTETGVTYNTQPATTTTNRVSLPESQTYTQDYPDIDVSGLVKDMIANPQESYGFMIRLQTEAKYTRMAFCSREHTDVASRPKLVITYSSVKIESGNFHNLLVKGDNTLWSWGQNQYGQLGDGSTISKSTPTQIGTNEWKNVSAGGYSSLALKTDGTIWAWGYNVFGQIGDGTVILRNSPVQIGGDTDWQTISMGDSYSLALKNNGTLWAWGNNANGQLGNDSYANNLVPEQVGTESDWVKISAGGAHVLALKADGTLWTWGLNSYGQLGDGTTNNNPFPTQISSDTDWEEISTGSIHSLALKADGTLWGWGNNTYGQVGDGTTNNISVPTQIGTANDWARISNGIWHSLAIKNDASLWTWGYNTYGQLGDGTTIHKLVPTQVLTNCLQSAAGWNHIIVINTSNENCGSGSNDFGQLGDGTTVSSTTFNCLMLASGLKSASVQKSTVNNDSLTLKQSDSYILQNYPNPLKSITTIEYKLADDISDARIVLFNMYYVAVRQYRLENNSETTLKIDLQDLPSGVYSYSLIINNATVDTKKLVIRK